MVREALDLHLRHESELFVPEDRRKLAEELIEGNRQLATHLQFPESYTFNREELYAEREDRWLQMQGDG